MSTGGEGKGPCRVVVHWRRAVFRRSSSWPLAFLADPVPDHQPPSSRRRACARPAIPSLGRQHEVSPRSPHPWSLEPAKSPATPFVSPDSDSSCSHPSSFPPGQENEEGRHCRKVRNPLWFLLA